MAPCPPSPAAARKTPTPKAGSLAMASFGQIQAWHVSSNLLWWCAMEDGDDLARFLGIPNGFFNFIFGEAPACGVRRYRWDGYWFWFHPPIDGVRRSCSFNYVGAQLCGFR